MSPTLNNMSSTLFNQISKTGIIVKAAQDAANGILKDLDLSETQKQDILNQVGIIATLDSSTENGIKQIEESIKAGAIDAKDKPALASKLASENRTLGVLLNGALAKLSPTISSATIDKITNAASFGSTAASLEIIGSVTAPDSASCECYYGNTCCVKPSVNEGQNGYICLSTENFCIDCCDSY